MMWTQVPPKPCPHIMPWVLLGRTLIQSRLCYIIGPYMHTRDQLIQRQFFVWDWLPQIQQPTGKTCSVYCHMIGCCPCQSLGSRVIFTPVKGWQFGWSNRQTHFLTSTSTIHDGSKRIIIHACTYTHNNYKFLGKVEVKWSYSESLQNLLSYYSDIIHNICNLKKQPSLYNSFLDGHNGEVLPIPEERYAYMYTYV